MENKPASNRRVPLREAPKPYMTISRWGVFGWLMSFLVFSGCMFVIGVIIGRNTAPVFDMEIIDAKMLRLKNSSLEQIEKGYEAAQEKRKHYLEVAKNIDIFEPLKEKGINLLAYKQNIPPQKGPKFDKNQKPNEESPPADQTGLQPADQVAPQQPVDQAGGLPGEQPTAQGPEMQVAMNQPGEQPPQAQPQENMSPAPDSLPTEVQNEQPPQPKPVVTKQGVAKPKAIDSLVKQNIPVLAQLEPKPQEQPEPQASVQTEENADVNAQEAATARESVDAQAAPVTDTQEAPIAQQSVDAGETPVVSDQTAATAQESIKETLPQEAPKTENACKQPAKSKQFTIQVASLRESDKANILKDKFRQKGYPAYCQSSPVRGEVWYRVRIGPYPDRVIAEKDCRRLEEAGFDALLFGADW